MRKLLRPLSLRVPISPAMGTIADRPRTAPIQKTLKTENGSKVKRLSLSSTVHKFGGVGSGVPRKIAHWRVAGRLDPFGMLPSQVVVNLLLKLGHGMDWVAD